jgi:hypothetical protein
MRTCPAGSAPGRPSIGVSVRPEISAKRWISDGIARHGLAAEILTDAKRHRDLRARIGMEARRLDPEVVRARGRGGRRGHRDRQQQDAAFHRASRERYPARRSRSTLPPDRTTPTRFPEKVRLPVPDRGRADDPGGLDQHLHPLEIQTSVSIISSSDTRRTSFTVSWMTGNVFSPGQGT